MITTVAACRHTSADVAASTYVAFRPHAICPLRPSNSSKGNAASTVDIYTFSLQQPLLPLRMVWNRTPGEHPRRRDHAMPRNRRLVRQGVKRVADLPRAMRQSGYTRYLTIRRDLAARDSPHNGIDLRESLRGHTLIRRPTPRPPPPHRTRQTP